MSKTEILQYIPFIRILIRLKKARIKSGGSKMQSSTGSINSLYSQTAPTAKKNLLLATVIELVSLLVLYLLLSPAFAMPLYNRIIFHPIPENDDLTDQIQNVERFFHCQFQAVEFKAPDGERLSGWYFKEPHATKTILVSHGNGGCIKHRLALCPLLLQSGCSVFLYDYEGFGDSTGSPSLPKLCDDSVAAFDYLTSEQHVQASNIILYGESIGAGVASELSKRRSAAAVILQSPFTSMQEVGSDLIFYLRLYPEWAFPTPRLNSAEIMKEAHPPLLIIHGMKDAMLPVRYSQKIMAQAAAPKKLVLLPNAGHVDMYKVDVNISMPAIDEFIGALP